MALAALALPLALHSTPGFGDRPASEAPIDAARAALNRGDGIDAEMKLRAALASGAARRDVAAWMGKAFIEQGDLDKARDWLAPGAFAHGTEADGWRALGLLEKLQGHLPESGRAYDKAMKLIPSDASLWVEIGRLRYAGGEHRKAIAAAGHALELDPANVRALQFGGQLVRDRYGLRAALPWFEKALLHDPKDVPVLLDYAATLGDLGRASDAVTVTRRVLDLSPKNPRAYYLQAVIAARAGNYQLARGLLLRTGDKLDELPGVQILRGAVEIAAGNYELAGDALEEALRMQPDCREAKNLLARAIYLAGQYRYVTLRFADELASGDASPYLLTVVARSYEVLGDRMHAGDLLDRAARAQMPVLRVVPHQGRIGELLAEAKGAEAQDIVESARNADPDFYDNQALAGDVQLALGNPEAAQERYAAASSIRMPESLFQRRFEAFAMAGDYSGARDLVEGYLRQNPTSRAALRAAVRLAIGTGDLHRADVILSWLRDNGGARDVRLRSDLALVQAREGDPEAARASALTAYRLQRSSPLATQALGFSYVAAGTRREDAQALLDKAQALSGNTPLIAEARRALLKTSG
ncbi:tetratricopeptide repeat protein [Novosphingobium album (ex Hu et al. 2023)]|uniref:Tetratricopeptide repeat protein n=1 Tax=Novosphingobium album (ex Hu et al. 2023) TaxID=2930093 RepID=A0ABT0AXQ0_9SPHN|nr:tetratricopeptide repeat protein [Novosphingobium album (ex Hu et al. 2023)]MCJ2177592.1 tetratricopeptide repeat protein [Novosphingobium album (ex Hu et al. 2023)]